MPSALLERLEDALDNPAIGEPRPEGGVLDGPRKLGRPKVLPEGYKTMSFRLGKDLVDKVDALRGPKSRSQFIRDLIEQA